MATPYIGVYADGIIGVYAEAYPAYDSTAPVAKKEVSFDGDSISTRYASLNDPAYGELVAADLGTANYQGYRIPAVPGQRTDQMLYRLQNGGAGASEAGGGTYTGSTLRTLNAGEKGVSVVLCGINGLAAMVYYGGTTTDVYGRVITQATIRQDFTDYIALAQTKRQDVLLCELPAGENSGESAAHIAGLDTERRSLNAWLLANWQAIGAAGLIRLATDYRLDTLADTTNTTYYAPDQVHLVAAGRRILANMAESGITQWAAGGKPVVLGTPEPGTGGNYITTDYITSDYIA